ncbi:uncharacterized protein K452DRAFT_325919 [Aplosporella prunicola CBS 121167]|uniref:TRUD domain-containing protein n=1 Tax=Aplosporella prunicola CBS 121167 TaxID=1176127 RepID=A0A6A6BKH7_9PEZI|nr:uncharacterized protein K452DRAFT_325919 [Aplosporella prunicola CBS 121167]KAF2143347.1 hypothetical protein K452DRAFT_325919 [Aplosporella prunicola CBS 121167]
MAEREELPSDRPVKRQKLSGEEQAPAAAAVAPTAANDANSEVEREIRAGITAHVNPDAPGFAGVLKQRYVDFLVNEIVPDGRVIHLEDVLGAKKPEEQAAEVKEEEAAEKQAEKEPPKEEGKKEISPEDIAKLQATFGERVTNFAVSLYEKVLSNPQKKARDFDSILSEPFAEKEDRTAAHQLIREVFAGRLDSSTQNGNAIKVGATPPRNRNNNNRGKWGSNENGPKGKLGWDELGGEYLHFTLYKENKDTMEVIYFIASQLKLQQHKHLSFAGTKDRRGVTVQRVAAKRVRAHQLEPISRRLNNARIGGLKHEQHPLSLGDLAGNEFVITLRDCHFPGEEGKTCAERAELAKSIVGPALESFNTRGFINYYGLQRFGSFASSTDAVGVRILNGDLSGAVSLILSYSPDALAAAQDPNSTVMVSSDDKNRALAIHTWHSGGRAGPALDLLPKRFQAERSIIQHLGWEEKRTREQRRKSDWQGALQAVPRNLRMMYTHAYQSLVWNSVAATRWQRFGDKVVAGDLVLVHEHRDKEVNSEPAEPEIDADGEVVILPSGEDMAKGPATDAFERARALSADEAASGKYNVFDIVLPLPGFDVEYPANEIGQFYKDFMGDKERGGGLDPHDMRRRWKDISLSGGYRKMMARPVGGAAFEVKTYTNDEEDLVETDLQKLEKEGKATPRPPREAKTGGDEQMEGVQEEKVAVILKFQLGTSQYATMALRELMKGGATAYQPEYNAGR